jgi:hypothetical protein
VGSEEATDAKAVMSRRVGGTFSAHAGHLRGRNLAIVPKRLIVQSWRGSNWKKGDLDSTLVLVFSLIGLRAGVALFDREAILTRWK